MSTKWTAVLCLLGASTLVAVNASALEPGQAAGPVRFENLDGVQRTMSAENYASRKATVVVFLSGRSEAVLGQMEAMNTLYARIRLDGVLFVGVCSDPNQSGDELRTFLQHTGGIIPLYRDPRGDAAKQFGATVTPEYFMLDANGALVYHGGLGQPGEGLELAIQQHLSGTPVTARAPLAGDPIGAAAPRTPVPDKYGTIYFASQLIFEKIPGAAVHHCSTVAEAPNGDILCLWYGGSYESSEDQALYLARQRRGEVAWEEPQRLLFDPNLPPGNAVLFQGPDRRLWIIWGRMESERPIRRGSGWGECRLMYRTSDDNGVTWSADAEVPDGFGSLPRNLPLTLADGRFAIPMSGEGRQAHGGSYLLFLDPAGPTWARSGYVRGGSQPTVIQRDSGELLMLMRSSPRIRQSLSPDGGVTWSDSEATELKNPGSGICMTRLKSGRILLAFSDTDGDDRTPFNLIQSDDGGATWTNLRTLEADWGEFSYPSILQASDGRIHLTYTYRRFSIKHTVFNENWLTTSERPN